MAAAGKSQIFYGFQFSDRITESQITFEHQIVDDAGKDYKAAHYDHGNGIAVADVDGDGLLDIITIDERRGVSIYFGQKDGSFSSELTLDQGKVSPYALAVGDLNLDGKIDIIVGNVEAPSTIFFNDGSGRHFTTVHFGDNKGTAYGFAIADLDRNGLPDIAVARSDATSMVYFGDHAAGQKAVGSRQ